MDRRATLQDPWEGHSYAAEGRTQPNRLEGTNDSFPVELAPEQSVAYNGFYLAMAYWQLGEKDKAFAELDKAYENREYQLRFLKIDPSVDSLRDDPRFKELMRRMRLPND